MVGRGGERGVLHFLIVEIEKYLRCTAVNSTVDAMCDVKELINLDVFIPLAIDLLFFFNFLFAYPSCN